jgi:aminoglycoside phosphotransferase family enzyme/predicted kinase
MSTLISEQAPMVLGLLRAEAYPHPCEEIRLVETHISWVFLTGEYAYKVKKPLNLGFLDFDTLEKRKRFCGEEVRLNSRTAPQVYMDVVPISGTPERPLVNSSDKVFEYAVRMRQFCEVGLLDRQLKANTLSVAKVESLAEKAAQLHAKIAVSGTQDVYGTPDSVGHWALENFDQLEAKIRHPERLKRLAGLRKWTAGWVADHKDLLEQRKRDGFVRECHGDLHLGNITEIDGEVVLFDGIEFNDEIRWIDVINELAFLFSDFEHRGVESLGWTALNRYLEITGDYPSLELFAFYRLYRLMVRAKIDSLRLAQPGLDDEEHDELEAEVEVYLEQGEHTVRESRPTLVLMRGLSGSGKTYISSRLLGELKAVRLRSDIERKRLFHVGERDSSGSGLGEGLYSPESSRQTFDKLLDLSRGVLKAGYHTIVDATFLKPDILAQFRALADEMGLSVKVLDVRAPTNVLESRLGQRTSAGSDASEANLEVLRSQLSGYQPIEGDDVVPLDGERPPAAIHLAKSILG